MLPGLDLPEPDSAWADWAASLPGQDRLSVDVGQDRHGISTAVFSANREHRYTLTRIWDPNRPITCFVMLNPSTADAFILDPLRP